MTILWSGVSFACERTATSSAARAFLASPSEMAARYSIAFLSVLILSLPKPFSVSFRAFLSIFLISSAVNGSNLKIVLLLISGELIAKKGFSVVAPMSVSTAFSTSSSSTSCCARLKRCISSMKRTVLPPLSANLAFARPIILRISFTDAAGALR